MDRARQLIDLLHLQPHPEGGWFAEVYRSRSVVQPADARGVRPALTTIYFLLRHGEQSALHVVDSNEVWHGFPNESADRSVVTWRAQPGVSRPSRAPGADP